MTSNLVARIFDIPSHHMSLLTRLSITLTSLVLAVPATAQPPFTTLGRSLARSSDGFTDIAGVHELEDGRVLLVDFRESRVVMLDFRRDIARDLVRTGEGPAELPLVLTLLPWQADTALIFGIRHALKVAPNGGVVEKMSMPFVRARLQSYSAPAFIDRQGRLYGWSKDDLDVDPKGGFVSAVGAWVIRTDLAGSRVDSLVRLSLRDPKQPLGKPWRPYPKTDAFAALPNGAVIVFRAQGYLVEVWRDGKLVRSQSSGRYSEVPIGEAEREAYRDDRLRPSGGGFATAPGPVSAGERAAARRALNVPDDVFPPFMSPFLEVRATVVDQASSEVWLARSFAAGATARQYDVFDATGNMVRWVLLERRGKVLGFGRGVVYVGYPDDDDVLRIEKLLTQ